MQDLVDEMDDISQALIDGFEMLLDDEVVDHQKLLEGCDSVVTLEQKEEEILSIEDEFEALRVENGWSDKQTYFYRFGPAAFAEKYGPKGK